MNIKQNVYATFKPLFNRENINFFTKIQNEIKTN